MPHGVTLFFCCCGGTIKKCNFAARKAVKNEQMWLVSGLCRFGNVFVFVWKQ